MVKGTTKTGFKFKVNEKSLEDVEFLEAFAELRNGDGLELFPVLNKVLGVEQKKALYDHCRDKDGLVPIEELSKEIEDIFDALQKEPETKN